ncbi:glycerophosphodiester phosphodiesterase [Bombilactobacillus thymidiniphilus]|uniref:Cell surface protein n=1 Tax=Bombilactobacillus thymidiniphilus TaxID=2923363 RepID=A0ABY4PDM8_9LACO|nr:glycerophosphodiester phosphodiesterase family protein [Bombilactobacillus thymidiniphilus]UQS83878.1 cell surface protein [Bombilactobacillus thymidiniphilus]
MSKKLSLTILLLITFIFNTGFTVVGHRGDPIKAPEESFQSIDSAFHDGAQWVELDVHESSDNQLIISHDRNLQRVTGQDIVVSQHPASQLTQLKQSNGQNIYTIDELFEHYQNNPNTKFLIETKKTKHGNPKNMEELLVNSIKKYHMEDRVMVHSFSLDSIKNMAKLDPKIFRIFIAGSLKRLNFEVFQYSNAVNVSSSILTPTLIDQLHTINQKVYVWDEMNENPQKWNWLVNLPIDGVVTNFPATASHYQYLKDHADHSSVNFDASVLADQNQPIWENPYPDAPQKGTLTPDSQIHIQGIVITDHQTFLQIDTNRFIKPTGIVQTDLVSNLAPFLQKQVIIKPDTKQSNLLTNPENKTSFAGSLQKNYFYQVTALQNIDGQSWAQINHQGWIKVNNLLVTNQNPLISYVPETGTLKRSINIQDQTLIRTAFLPLNNGKIQKLPQITYTDSTIANNLNQIKSYILD